MNGADRSGVAGIGTVNGLLARRRAISPDGVAMRFPAHGTSMTWTEWERDSERMARALLDLGLVRGDRVALLAENRIEWAVIHLAVARAGLLLVPINTHVRADDLAYALHQSASRLIFLTPAFRSNEYARVLDTVRDRLPALEHTVLIDRSPSRSAATYDDVLRSAARSATVLPEISRDDPAVLIYTSGTTGAPKGVVLRHAAIVGEAEAVFDRLGVDDADVVSSIVPMFHSGAFCVAVPGCLATGATYVGVDAFDAVDMMRIIQDERATVHTAVPATLRAMLRHPRRKEFDLSSLRVGTCGGADADPKLLADCRREFPIPGLVEAYGLTEAAALVTCAAPESDRGVPTAGFPLRGYEVRIVSTSTGEVLPPLVSGEVQVRSENVMIEYFRMPEETAKAFTADGWLRTGDLGELTESGELRMTGGRLKDMIIRGGENIYPAEVENTLAQHPLVLEAAVFGVPDDALGEVVAAAVICRGEPSVEELTRFCAERIARYKAPAVYYRVEAFPLTPSEKIRKNELRDQAAAGALTSLGAPSAQASAGS